MSVVWECTPRVYSVQGLSRLQGYSGSLYISAGGVCQVSVGYISGLVGCAETQYITPWCRWGMPSLIKLRLFAIRVC